VVSVLNGQGETWAGNWNETAITWVPQVVNFDLQSNFVSSYVPTITDFSNANSSNGLAGYSTIGYTLGSTYTTSVTDCSTIFFWGSCTSSSFSNTSAITYTSLNGNLFVSQQFWTSGTALLDALNRTVWISSVNYYDPIANPQFPAQQPIVDWLTPTTYAAHGGYLLEGWGANGYGVKVYYQYPTGGHVTTSTTQASTGVKAVVISLDLSYFVGGGVTVVDLSWSQSGSATTENTLGWTAQVPNAATAPTCYVVYGEGGSQTAATADMIGMWAYGPTQSGGQYTCPLP
jgi:hypothetical protein